LIINNEEFFKNIPMKIENKITYHEK